mmetsp:Transcript_2052/g.2814  ORF Transcript_2052/g.2814 Transcript_2052/m.2814 type:complete len:88 (+) Transcript_2052:95-358(+)
MIHIDNDSMRIYYSSLFNWRAGRKSKYRGGPTTGRAKNTAFAQSTGLSSKNQSLLFMSSIIGSTITNDNMVQSRLETCVRVDVEKSS